MSEVPPPPMPPTPPPGSASSGFGGPVSEQEKKDVTIMYVLGLVICCFPFAGPLFYYLTQKGKSEFVTFHARQALYFGLAVFILQLILSGVGSVVCIGPLLSVPVGIAALIIYIMALLKAKEGEWYKIPYIADFNPLNL